MNHKQNAIDALRDIADKLESSEQDFEKAFEVCVTVWANRVELQTLGRLFGCDRVSHQPGYRVMYSDIGVGSLRTFINTSELRQVGVTRTPQFETVEQIVGWSVEVTA